MLFVRNVIKAHKFQITSCKSSSSYLTLEFSFIPEKYNPIPFEKIKKIDDDESKFMIRIFYAFGNTEIVKQLITRKETSNEMTIENAIENILQKQSFLESIQSTQYGTNKQVNSTDKFNDINEFDDIHFFDNELKFIANHFYELKNEQKVKLGFEFLKEIIKSNELRLETEDSLLEFINSIYIENQLTFKYLNIYSKRCLWDYL